jgi:hypothetical protein
MRIEPIGQCHNVDGINGEDFSGTTTLLCLSKLNIDEIKSKSSVLLWKHDFLGNCKGCMYGLRAGSGRLPLIGKIIYYRCGY